MSPSNQRHPQGKVDDLPVRRPSSAMPLHASGAPQLPGKRPRPSSAMQPGRTDEQHRRRRPSSAMQRGKTDEQQKVGTERLSSKDRPSSAPSRASLRRSSEASDRRRSSTENSAGSLSSQDLQRRSTEVYRRLSVTGVPRLRSASAPALPVARRSSQADCRTPAAPELKGEARRQHIRAVYERRWLRSKGKHAFVDFSEDERHWLRRYFDALAEGDAYMPLDQLEDMLISLNLAKTHDDVCEFTRGLAKDEGLCFDAFLKMVATRLDRHTMHTFKRMMEGQLGDPDLHFQTVISQHRRQLVLGATGARGACMAASRSLEVMRNFAAQQEGRMDDALAGADDHDKFEEDGSVPLGKLKGLWQVECKAHGVIEKSSTAEHPNSALEQPESPRALIQRIVQPSIVKPLGTRWVSGTLMIDAPQISFKHRGPMLSQPNSPKNDSEIDSTGAGEHAFDFGHPRRHVAWAGPAKKT
mmetsp:Transcript_22736/g.43668  ORF Transcript_22736/g.43668 Transcript_22736/m.43668 type:complete len:470 (-) Transcript_22736:94-1503(-)